MFLVKKLFHYPFKLLKAIFRPIFKPSPRGKIRLLAALILMLAVLVGLLDYPKYWDKSADFINGKFDRLAGWNKLPFKNKGFDKFVEKINLPYFYRLPFRLGLDLQGGAHLVYQADLAGVAKNEYNNAMEGVKDVIERRVNAFGVSEPIIQVEKVGDNHRLIIELAGVKEVGQAIKMIGETPFLEFKQEQTQEETVKILSEQSAENQDQLGAAQDPYFKTTGLGGKQLKSAEVLFDQQTSEPTVSLEFNDDGKKLFKEITEQNIGKRIAIYLDGAPISAPTVKDAIPDGKAVISGSFTVEEARQLTRRLNAGALPVPITLLSQQTIGASLGEVSLQKSLQAGIIGLLAVAIFMIAYYRLPGLLSVVALLIYTGIILAIFKLIPVVLTLAGIAGFILSIGMAVDANILIFERMKEEIRSGRSLLGSVDEGFKRAWTSIRDSNVSSIITSVILIWLGTSVVKGFAVTLLIGILVSMFSAITVTKTFLRLVAAGKAEKVKWLFG